MFRTSGFPACGRTGYFALVLPKLDIVAVDELLRPFYRRIIVAAVVQLHGLLNAAV